MTSPPGEPPALTNKTLVIGSSQRPPYISLYNCATSPLPAGWGSTCICAQGESVKIKGSDDGGRHESVTALLLWSRLQKVSEKPHSTHACEKRKQCPNEWRGSVPSYRGPWSSVKIVFWKRFLLLELGLPPTGVSF